MWRVCVCIYTHTQYYSSFEKKAVVLFLTIWVNLEDSLLSKISQTQKDKYCMILLICGKKVGFMVTESR